MVVDPLRDLEKARVAFDHNPPGIHPRAACVRKERLQELRDAAAGRRRVHIHDRTTLQQRACCRGARLEPLGALGTEQRTKPGGGKRPDLDLLQRHPRSSGRN